MNPSELFRWFAPMVPYALIWLVGAVVAISTWRRHPNVSLLTLLACLIELAATLGGGLVQFILFRSGSFAGGGFDLVLQLTTWGRVLLSCLGYVLFFCAIFGWRRQAEPFPRPYDDPPRRAPRDLDDYGGGRPGSEDIRKPRS